MATFAGTVTLKCVKGVWYVNSGKTFDGENVSLVCRNLAANCGPKQTISVHTKPVNPELGNRFGKVEFLALIKAHEPCLRKRWNPLKANPAKGFWSPYLSLVAEDGGTEATATAETTEKVNFKIVG
jgi:hypothetical protein